MCDLRTQGHLSSVVSNLMTRVNGLGVGSLQRLFAKSIVVLPSGMLSKRVRVCILYSVYDKRIDRLRA